MSYLDVKVGNDRREQLIQFIESYTKTNVWPPTKKEMCAHLGVGLRALEGHLQVLRDSQQIETSAEWRGVRVRV